METIVILIFPTFTIENAPIFKHGIASTIPFHACVSLLKDIVVNKSFFCKYLALKA